MGARAMNEQETDPPIFEDLLRLNVNENAIFRVAIAVTGLDEVNFLLADIGDEFRVLDISYLGLDPDRPEEAKPSD
jgi:hypothetical protein